MFRTELHLSDSSFGINYENKLFTIGSCFSQVIGEELVKNKFDVLVNPFGTIFNPVSIFKILEKSLSNNSVFSDAAIENKGTWFNYDVHSELYGTTKEELTSIINEKIKQANKYLNETDVLIITLGTAFVYKLKSNKEVVANCHKQPASNFTKELLTVEEIITSFTSFLNQLKIENREIKIILTVSPVRHTKDTLVLNSVSKSILRMACHSLTERFPEVFYFPSYEIMMDDLRDYRFYKEDMIHPTEVAEKYIWNKFADAYFGETTKETIKEWSSVRRAIQHKPFRVDSEEYRRFLEETLKKLKALNEKIDVREEIELIGKRIS